MPRIAYVNGRYMPLSEAAVSVEDRGFQLSDAVYEVCEVRGGRLVDEPRHYARLARSLGELRIPFPMPPAALGAVLREAIRRNRAVNALLYLQVGRGVARRDHAFPKPAVSPSVVITVRPFDVAAAERRAATGIAVATMPDNRWGRVDIKSVALLPNVLAKQAAREAGAFEAWLVDDDGLVTEGSSSNAWIVSRAGEVLTAPVAHTILRGITRDLVAEIALAAGLILKERQFSVSEAQDSAEAFITSATSFVTPVVAIDGRPVGSGRPGTLALRLRPALLARQELAPPFSTPAV